VGEARTKLAPGARVATGIIFPSGPKTKFGLIDVFSPSVSVTTTCISTFGSFLTRHHLTKHIINIKSNINAIMRPIISPSKNPSEYLEGGGDGGTTGGTGEVVSKLIVVLICNM